MIPLINTYNNHKLKNFKLNTRLITLITIIIIIMCICKLGSQYKWLRKNWSYRFRNSLIEFFDQENTKITLLWQLEPEILTKVRLGGGSVEIWPPTVVKSNFFSFNVENIVCRKKF